MAYRCKLNQVNECIGCQECLEEPELRCSVCDSPIYEGDYYYNISEDIYCEDCLKDLFEHIA